MYATVGKFENSFTPFIPSNPNAPDGKLWESILISGGISSLDEAEQQNIKGYFHNGSVLAIIEPTENGIQETIDYLVPSHISSYPDKPDILCLYRTQEGAEFRAFFSSAYDISTDFLIERYEVESVPKTADSPSTSSIDKDIAPPPKFTPNRAEPQNRKKLLAISYHGWDRLRGSQ